MTTRGKRAKSSHWLNDRWWRLAIGEWIALTLAFLAVVLIFCLFFIRRHTLEYHIEHTFSVSDPEFFGSALALSDPIPVPGNKIELLQNGDEYFPAMIEAIRSAQRTVNFEAYIVYSDAIGRQFRDALSERAHAGLEVRVLLDGIGSGWKLNNSDVRMMKEAGCKFSYYHPTHSLARGPNESAFAPPHSHRRRESGVHGRGRFFGAMVRSCAGSKSLARCAGAHGRSARRQDPGCLPGTLGQDIRRGLSGGAVNFPRSRPPAI